MYDFLSCIQEFEELWKHLDLICDGGPLADNNLSRSGSTVVDLSVEGQYKIIREGRYVDFIVLISLFVGVCFLLHLHAMKAQASLHKCAVSSETSLLAHTK